MSSEPVHEKVHREESVVGEQSVELHEERGECEQVDGPEQEVEESVGGECGHEREIKTCSPSASSTADKQITWTTAVKW